MPFISSERVFITTGTQAQTAAALYNAGNLSLVSVSWWATSGRDVSSVQDTAGNTYTPVASTATYPIGDRKHRWYYSANITGHANNVITVTFSTDLGGDFANVVTLQFSEAAIASVLDAIEVTTGASGDPASTTAITTSQADTILVIGGETQDAVNPLEPTNFTSAFDNDRYLVCYRIVSAIQTTQSYSIDLDSSTGYLFSVAAFKIATVAAGTPFFTQLGAKRI